MNILSDDQLHDYCIEVAKCPALLDELTPYAKQALKHYATDQQIRIKSYEPSYQAYCRAYFPVYAAADVVSALLDAPTPTLAPSEGKKTAVPNASARAGRVRKQAKLEGLKLETVRTIFNKAGLGPTSGAGEWGAAIIALTVGGCLVGGPPSLYRWFVESHFPGSNSESTSRRTLQDQKDLNQPEQFSQLNEGTVFKSVVRQVNQLKA